MSLLLGGILAGGKFALDAYGNWKKRDALEGQKKLTPEEASYKKKLTELSTKGDPNINKIRNRRISAIRQVGSDTQQKITGDLIQMDHFYAKPFVKQFVHLIFHTFS